MLLKGGGDMVPGDPNPYERVYKTKYFLLGKHINSAGCFVFP